LESTTVEIKTNLTTNSAEQENEMTSLAKSMSNHGKQIGQITIIMKITYQIHTTIAVKESIKSFSQDVYTV